MVECDSASTSDLEALVSLSGNSHRGSLHETRGRFGLPNLTVLEKVFPTGRDISPAAMFVTIAVGFFEVVRVEVVCGKRGANLTPVINVIYRGMTEQKRNEMLLALDNSQHILGRDLERLRFEYLAVDEATIATDRRNSPDFVNKRTIPVWVRPETPTAA